MKESGLDPILNLLAAGDRRAIVHILRQQSTTGETSIDDIAKRLAVDGQVTENDRERLSIRLHHTHLPKLADRGLVEFDPDRGTVQYNPNDNVEQLIDSLLDSDHPAIQSGSAD